MGASLPREPRADSPIHLCGHRESRQGGTSLRRRAQLLSPRWVVLIATRKLVDSDEEQGILEELIDAHKPRLSPQLGGLHYLLFTPFRYPPLRHGSRFGTRSERGIWYGAESPRTAFAEVAYYRLLFLEGTAAELEPLTVELSLFQAAVRTDLGVDLVAEPFVQHSGAISSKTSYRAAQALGRDMRAAGAEAFRYVSARDTEGGANIALISPRAFARKVPRTPRTWFCTITRGQVELSKKDFFAKHTFRFPRSDFEVRGKLPSPAL